MARPKLGKIEALFEQGEKFSLTVAQYKQKQVWIFLETKVTPWVVLP